MVLVHLDDIIVYDLKLKQHCEKLEQVLAAPTYTAPTSAKALGSFPGFVSYF